MMPPSRRERSTLGAWVTYHAPSVLRPEQLPTGGKGVIC